MTLALKHAPIIDVVVAKAGGWRSLARALDMRYQAIQSWKVIPADRIIQIERVIGIPREELRPDLYAPRKKAG